MRVSRRVIACTAVAAMVTAGWSQTGIASAATPASPGQHHAVAESTPKWLAKAKPLGGASTASSVNFRVYLAPRGGVDAVKAAVASVSTPGSAKYRKFITPATYHRPYDPTAATVAAVKSWLTADGLKVGAVGEYNSYLQVTGTVAQTQAAFGTTIRRFQHDGKTGQANATPLVVPAALSTSVLTVTGIDPTPAIKEVPASTALPADPPPPAFANGRPCSVSYGQLTASVQADLTTPLPKFDGKYLPIAVCGYTGPQFRAAYEGNSSLTGAGVTVGIVDAYAAPTIAYDSNRYARTHGDGSYVNGQLTQTVASKFTNGAECGPSGWYGEETLDVEGLHAVGPDAKIPYYAAASCPQ